MLSDIFAVAQEFFHNRPNDALLFSMKDDFNYDEYLSVLSVSPIILKEQYQNLPLKKKINLIYWYGLYSEQEYEFQHGSSDFYSFVNTIDVEDDEDDDDDDDSPFCTLNARFFIFRKMNIFTLREWVLMLNEEFQMNLHNIPEILSNITQQTIKHVKEKLEEPMGITELDITREYKIILLKLLLDFI